MGKPKFTKMQQAAIDIKNKNILVSAAAGSGKTAVLVSRIIDRVLNKENPVDIDRILVMTFTRAAASSASFALPRITATPGISPVTSGTPSSRITASARCP